MRVSPSTVSLGDGVTIEEGKLSIAAGPCSIENDEQIAGVIEGFGYEIQTDLGGVTEGKQRGKSTTKGNSSRLKTTCDKNDSLRTDDATSSYLLFQFR